MTLETYDNLKEYVGSKDGFADDLLNMGYTKGKRDAIDEFLDLLANELGKAEHYIECVNGDRVGLSSNEICACIERAKEKVKEQNKKEEPNMAPQI